MRNVSVGLFILVYLLGGCGPRDSSGVRTWREPPSDSGVSAESAVASPPSAPLISNEPVSWTLPAGWIVREGRGIRRATFEVRVDEEVFECSLTILPGDAGGVEANARRWATQIGRRVDGLAWSQWLDGTAAGMTTEGAPLWILDYSQWPGADAAAASMLAAIVRRRNDTLFLKMVGTMEVLFKVRDDFIQLARSLK